MSIIYENLIFNLQINMFAPSTPITSKNLAQQQSLNVSQSDFIFCYSTSLRNIVMLSNHQHIINSILQDVVEPHYFWICERTDRINIILKSLPPSISGRSRFFQTSSDMKSFISQNKLEYERIVLIYGFKRLKNIDELTILMRSEIFVKAIVLDFDDQINQKIHDDTEKNLNLEIESMKISRCRTQEELKIVLKNNQWGSVSQRSFPNFVLLRQQQEKSEIFSRAHSSIVNFQISFEVRCQILTELTKLIELLIATSPNFFSGFSVLLQTIQALRKVGPVSKKTIIQLYTSESERLYVLINLFLRGLGCPTEVFYIQPIVQELYFAIKECHQTSCSNFVCYRGGYLEISQFHQIRTFVGQVLQNLGFLSTSHRLEVAKSFQKNIFYQILVKDKKMIPSGGFAFVGSMSEYFSEEEIIFNPMNYFKVLEVQQKTFINKFEDISEESFHSFFVVFEYISCLKESHFDDQNAKVLTMLFRLHDIENQKKQLQNQCSALFFNSNTKCFSKCLVYYNFLKKIGAEILSNYFELIVENHETKVIVKSTKFSYEGLAEFFHYLATVKTMGDQIARYSQLEEAMKIYTFCKVLCEQFLGKSHIMYFEIVERMSNCLWNLKRIEEAKVYVEDIYTRGKQIFKENSPLYQYNLQKWIRTFSPKWQREKGIPLLLKNLEIQRETWGELDPNTLQNMHIIGRIYLFLGELDKANEMITKCLAMQKALMGEESLNYLITLDMYGKLLAKQAKPIEALKCWDTYSDTLKKIFGENSYYYLMSLQGKAEGLRMLARYPESLQICYDWMNRIKKIYGDHHILYFQTLAKTAGVLFSAESYHEALDLYRKIDRSAFRQEFNYFCQMGQSLMHLEKYEEALLFLEYDSQLIPNSLGEFDFCNLKAITNISKIYVKLGEIDNALKELGKFDNVTNLKKKYPLHYAAVLNLQGIIYRRIGRYAKAVSIDKEGYDLNCQMYGIDHSDSSISLCSYALSLWNAGDASGFDILQNSIRKGNCSVTLWNFFEVALFAGQFEKVQDVLRKRSLKQISQKFSYFIKILIRIPKFTNYQCLLQRVIRHKKKQAKTKFGIDKQSLHKEIRSFEYDEIEISVKKQSEVKKQKQAKNWLTFF